MPQESVEPSTSSDSDDADLMKARTRDYSDEEENKTLARRRKRKVRGRGSVRARERSLTPDAGGTRLPAKVAPIKKVIIKKADASSSTKSTFEVEPEPEEEEKELKEVIKILPSEALGEDEGWGDKEDKPENTNTEKQITKSQPAPYVEENKKDTTDKASEFEEETVIEEEEEDELLNPRDPRFVPKHNAFYMHDTKRMTTMKDREPFTNDHQDDDETYVLGDAFEPTKNGKWGHDMFDKICDKSKRHTQEDHWGKSYGFRRQNFQNNFGPPIGGRRDGPINDKRPCVDWQEGRCNYGYSCKFLHDDNDRQQSQDRDQWNGGGRVAGVCYDWQSGQCNRGSRCRFSHSENGAGGGGGNGVCYDWQKGRCNRGNSCRFDHDEYDGGGGGAGDRGRSNGICFDFQRGQCHREYCRFSHEGAGNARPSSRSPRRDQPGVCYNWWSGICNRGNSCRFLHESYNNREGKEKPKDKIEKTTNGGRSTGAAKAGSWFDESQEDNGWEDNVSSPNKAEDQVVEPSINETEKAASQKDKTQLSEDKLDQNLETSKPNTELSGFGDDKRKWDEYSSCDDGNFN